MSAPSTRRVVGGHPARAARVARALQALEAEGWLTLSRVHRPGGGRRHIDHVLVGPGGVVVVDSHLWVGRIEVSRGAVQQNGFWREPETAEVAGIAGGVAALLQPQHRSAVHALICVAQHDLAHHVVPPGVHVAGITDVGQVLRGLPHRLHPAEVRQLHAHLRHTLVDTVPPGQLTTAELDRLPLTGPPCWAPDDDPADLGRELFLPVSARSLRSVTRTAARRRRSPRAWRGPGLRGLGWRGPGWRAVTTRMVLAALVAMAVVLLGPTVLHRNGGDAQQFRIPAPSAPSASVVPAPYTPAPDGSAPYTPAPYHSAPDGSGPGGSVPPPPAPSAPSASSGPSVMVQEISDGDPYR